MSVASDKAILVETAWRRAENGELVEFDMINGWKVIVEVPGWAKRFVRSNV